MAKIDRALQARSGVISLKSVEGQILPSSTPIDEQPLPKPPVVEDDRKRRRLMKSPTLPALILSLAIGFAGPALAKKDRPGLDWMPAEQVKQKLMDEGYTSIDELEADEGHWEGEGLKNGVKMEFHVDPKTDAITKEKPDKD